MKYQTLAFTELQRNFFRFLKIAFRLEIFVKNLYSSLYVHNNMLKRTYEVLFIERLYELCLYTECTFEKQLIIHSAVAVSVSVPPAAVSHLHIWAIPEY